MGVHPTFHHPMNERWPRNYCRDYAALVSQCMYIRLASSSTKIDGVHLALSPNSKLSKSDIFCENVIFSILSITAFFSLGSESVVEIWGGRGAEAPSTFQQETDTAIHIYLAVEVGDCKKITYYNTATNKTMS